MKHAPITISPELAAKYDGEGQFDTFDKAFQNVLKADPAAIPPLEEEEPKKPRGRPRKSNDEPA